jgi:hypothetical protein
VFYNSNHVLDYQISVGTRDKNFFKIWNQSENNQVRQKRSNSSIVIGKTSIGAKITNQIM